MCCTHPKAGWNTFFSHFQPFLLISNVFLVFFFIMPSYPPSRAPIASFVMWEATVLVEWFSPDYHLYLMLQTVTGVLSYIHCTTFVVLPHCAPWMHIPRIHFPRPCTFSLLLQYGILEKLVTFMPWLEQVFFICPVQNQCKFGVRMFGGLTFRIKTKCPRKSSIKFAPHL